MSDTNTIRPGIRAERNDGVRGIIGICPDQKCLFLPDRRGASACFYERRRFTPLPFEPGDRVEDCNFWKSRATVVKGRDGATTIHLDGSDKLMEVEPGLLTLVDYPGKETK